MTYLFLRKPFQVGELLPVYNYNIYIYKVKKIEHSSQLNLNVIENMKFSIKYYFEDITYQYFMNSSAMASSNRLKSGFNFMALVKT